MTLLLCAVAGVNAETYKITFNGKDKGDTDYFTNSGNHSFNTKFKDCTYDGVDYTSGLKMESATSVSWTSTAEATVTIVQSTWSDKTIKLDGTELAVAGAEAITGGRVYTITKVAAGPHSMTRGSGESGVFAIYVEYTGAVKTQLSDPVITFNAATGKVSIASDANATKVTYTTDGTTPTAESTEYAAPFDAADGTVVKAIAIGDDVSYINSNVASETVLLTGITISEPVIKKFNGAVAITCASPNATIKYSIDGGATYKTYVRPFTLIANATVQAYAERTGCTTSSEASLGVDVVANVFTKTIYLDWSDFDNNDKNSATGKTGTVAEGYTLAITGNADKKWSSNGFNITTPDGEKREWKVSNGAQNTLTIPAGVHVTRLTIYSIINSEDHSAICGWKEVGGVNYQTGDDDYKNVPMGSYSNVKDYNTNPDVRVYDIDQTGGTITFTNAGAQLCFVIALDILEDNATATIGSTGWSTFVCGAPLDFTSVTGLKAYIVTGHSGNAITTTQMTGTVPANTPLLLEGATTAIPVAASSSTDVSANKLKAGAGVAVSAESGKTKYVLSAKEGNAVFKKINATDATVPVGKAYLEFAEVISAPELDIVFDGSITGISATLVNSEKVNSEIFNLQGQRVAQPAKGLYIVNGKKVIIK